MANDPNLGDLQWKGTDPLETYFDTLRQGIKLPRRKWIVKPEWTPAQCDIPAGLQPIVGLIECYGLPRLWQVLTDLWTKFQCGTYFVKSPNWIEPPITARCLDCRTEDCVEVPPTYGNPTDQTVYTFTMPDRYVGTILGFGHAIVKPSQWGSLVWNIKVNGAPQPCYQNFKQQIGEFHRPTLFPSPIRLKHKDKLEITVANPLNEEACVFVRVYGFIFPSKMLTQDGSFGEYHTL